MNLTDQIATPEQAKQISDLNIDDLSTLWYYPYKSNEAFPASTMDEIEYFGFNYDYAHPAPTLHEVLEWFRKEIDVDEGKWWLNLSIWIETNGVSIEELNETYTAWETLELFDKHVSLCHNAVDALIWYIENCKED